MPGSPGKKAIKPADVRALADRDVVTIAGLQLRVAHAPGHSAGCVVFSLGGADDVDGAGGADQGTVFTGDVLFAGSIGRVDLPGGSREQMSVSLREVILPLPDSTVVHPGHGASTTIERERRTNPFLRGL